MAYPKAAWPNVANTGSFVAHHMQSRSFTEGTSSGRSRLRRTVSIRAVNAHLDSSESIPSDHSSLYLGHLTSFDGYDEDYQTENPLHIEGYPSSQPLDVANGVHIRKINTSASCGAWRAHVLEPITEQSSVSTLKFSVAPPPIAVMKSVDSSLKSEASYLFVLGKRYGNKIYSFDDLDIPSIRPKFSFASLPTDLRRSARLSSSAGSIRDDMWYDERYSPVEPTEPIYPPPIRCPTPPGIPSFGSPEAIRFQISTRPSQSSESAGNNRSAEDCLCCFFGFRRLFSSSSAAQAPAPPLPTGVVSRADDGTFVRGRFGTRNSGHGVGAGLGAAGLENHPFHHESLPIACRQPMERSVPSSQDQRQTSLCCTATPPASVSSQAPPRPSSLRSASSRTSSNYPLPRRVHFVDGTRPNETSSVPIPSYIRYPPLVPPAPGTVTMHDQPTQGIGRVTVNNRTSEPCTSSSQTICLGTNSSATSSPRYERDEDISLLAYLADCCGLSAPFYHAVGNNNIVTGNPHGEVVTHRRRFKFLETWSLKPASARQWRLAWGYQPYSSG
ncbi:hypothetical protein LOZ65_004386 [Ophidiomyces ophidiicola]|nr:hypothetical protein LOZ65_004386 [Ophidiomyces ophidiicola]